MMVHVVIEAEGPELAAECAAARREIGHQFDVVLARVRAWDLPERAR
mgnify:CR=1 FL=1